MRCVIALGSNIGEGPEQLRAAFADISALPGTQAMACSSLYTSPPMAAMQQSDYTNAVALIDTTLSPIELLDRLQAIELEHGRERHERWGPRTLDLDIIDIEGTTLSSERLTTPHYGLAKRAFVLLPLFEIAPNHQLSDGRQIATLLAQCPSQDLYQMADSRLL